MGSIGAWISAFFAKIFGTVDRSTDKLRQDPDVMKHEYGSVIQEKSGSARRLKEAIATLIRTQEGYKTELERVEDEAEELATDVAGAEAAAIARANKLVAAGKSQADVEADPEYLGLIESHTDWSSSLGDKRARITDLETLIAQLGEQIDEQTLNLKGVMRQIEDLKVEQAQAVAEVISNKELAQINDMLSGLATDGTGERLRSLREARGQVKAEARLSAALAGTDTTAQRAKVRSAGRSAAAKDAPAATPAPAADTAQKRIDQLP